MRMQRFVLFLVLVVAMAFGGTAWAQPAGVVSPGSFSFNNRHIGTPVQTTFTVTNTQVQTMASDALNVTAIAESGAGCGQFEAAPTSFTVAGGGALFQTVTVTYTPSTRGDVTCTLTLTDNDGNDDTFVVSGTGTLPDIGVSAAALPFGNVHVTTPSNLTFDITNRDAADGGASNEIATYTIVPSGSTDFVVTSSLTGFISPGEAVTINVRYTPSTRGAAAGSLLINGNDSTDDTVTLSGFGRSGNMVVDWTNEPGNLNCGSAQVSGGATSTCVVTVSNPAPGNELLTISAAITLGGTDFTSAVIGDSTLTVGQSTTVTVTFNPGASGGRSGRVTIGSDDDFTPADVLVPLIGTGTDPVISLNPAVTLNVGTIHLGSTPITNTVIVDNLGDAVLDVTDMTITGADMADFSFASPGCTGQSCGLDYSVLVTPSNDTEIVTISCNPSTIGLKVATLNFFSDHVGGDVAITLNCTGTAPNIVVSQTERNFGNRVIGATPFQMTFTIQNTQSSSEQLDYTFTKTGSPAFSVSPACGTTCTNNGVVDTFTVTFTPLTPGAHAGLITINHDDPDAGVVTVSLSGFAQAPVISDPQPGLIVNVGSADLGQTSTPARTISITNSGDAALSISLVEFTGGDASEFTFTTSNQGVHTVDPDAPDSWTVTCTPTARDRTTTMRIHSNNLGDSTFDITLNCTGLEAVFTVSPAGLNFGPVPAMTTSSGNRCGSPGFTSPCRLTITNNGNKAGNLTSISSTSSVYGLTVSGGNVPPSRNVPVGGAVTVDVAFTPANGDATRRFMVVASDGSPASQSIPLDGDGITQGVDISVGPAEPTLDVNLGDVRVGVTTGRLVTIRNSGDTAFTLGIPTSDDARCQVALVSPTTPNWPINIFAGGAIATFNVNVTPTTVGAESCTITVTSNIPPTGTSDPINFTFNGVAPGVELVQPAGGTLAFGGLDVDATAMQLPVEIRNPGTFLLTIASCAITGPSAARFAIPACPDVTVLPGESTTMMVSYDPTVEALDDATLTFFVDALGVPNVVVPITGIGLDQRLDLPALLYEFPDTFRNPTDPPEVQVVVGNPVSGVTGTGAPLTVSMAVVEAADAAVFEVVDAGPLTVAPGTTTGVRVRFRPVTTGIFETDLTIHNDATGMEMATVRLRGTAIERMVNVPGRFDLGVTGVGIPVRLTEVNTTGVLVQSLDSENDYTIDRIGFVDVDGNTIDGGPFRIVDDLAGQTLTSGGMLAFDVEFVADAPSRFSVFVGVYLDGDPNPHGMRTELIGEAVDVEIQGGGCQTGRDPGGAALLVVGLGLLLLGRRRRRGAVGAVAGLVVLVVAVAPARAEPTRNVEISTFVPAPATEVEGFGVESPLVGVNGAWALGLAISYATDVLTMGAASISEEVPDPITARTALQLGFAYAFLERFEAGVRVPLYQQSGDDEHLTLAPTGEFPEGRRFTGLEPAEGTALGDAALHLKAQAVDTGQFAAAGSVDVTVPTGKDGEFAGVDGASGHLRGIAGLRIGRVGVTGNVGFIVRGTGDLANIRQGNSLSFGAGARFRALEQLWVVAEAFGTTGPGAAMDDGTVKQGVTQLEGVAGIRYEVGRTIGVSVGGGRGIISGAGAPALRGFLLIDVAPKAREVAPLVIRKPPPPRDTRDDDSDGIANADDQCATDAEDGDGYMDADGCPEADNDEDGLLDDADKCPIEAEDMDGTTDGDGCVDPDNDSDGIFDVDDKCPNEAEDKDGHMDNDGCDEPDNDADGIPDVIDQCALEPEAINGNADDDGCPDNGDSLVMIMPDRVEIFEPVTFTGTTANLTKKSANVLGQVAATLRANRDFKRVRVTVHVHPRGNGDEELSRKRAKVVRDWLVQWGIEPERVEDKGLGSSRPLVPKAQKGAAGLNDRVEFIILEKETGAK